MVLEVPVDAAVIAEVDAAIVAQHEVARVLRIDPQRVMIDVHVDPQDLERPPAVE
jgi:hypothetical protein